MKDALLLAYHITSMLWLFFVLRSRENVCVWESGVESSKSALKLVHERNPSFNKAQTLLMHFLN
jgi:hypothetical protein